MGKAGKGKEGRIRGYPGKVLLLCLKRVVTKGASLVPPNSLCLLAQTSDCLL